MLDYSRFTGCVSDRVGVDSELVEYWAFLLLLIVKGTVRVECWSIFRHIYNMSCVEIL